MVNKIMFGEKALSASVVASREMDLGKPEGIFWVVWRLLASCNSMVDSSSLVRASSLSPI